MTSFYKHQDIEIPNMDTCFSSVRQSRRRKKSVTVDHHYRVELSLINNDILYIYKHIFILLWIMFLDLNH
jgi:hypothetical protein